MTQANLDASLNHLLSDQLTLYYDSNLRKVFVAIKNNSTNELWPLESAHVKAKIFDDLAAFYGKAVSANHVEEVVRVLKIKGDKASKIHTSLRVGENEAGDIEYDLSNESWQCVSVNKNSWSIGPCKASFRRYDHQFAQIAPTKDGDFDMLFDFINVTEPNARVLLKAWVLACFYPGIDYPMLLLTGQRGSGKTTACNFLRRLIDPSVLEHGPLPNQRDLLIQASMQHLLVFDNTDSLRAETSDNLSRISTGGGAQYRKLYSDDGLFIMQFRRPIVLNGLHNQINKSDLMSRIVWLEIDPPKKRASKKLLEQNFNTQLPSILAGIFDALSKTLKELPTTSDESLHRLADFHMFGRAMCKALYNDARLFDLVLDENGTRLSSNLRFQNQLASVVEVFMQQKTEWSGQATDLYNKLSLAADNLSLDRRDFSWPKSPAAMSMQLKNLEDELKEIGIKFERTHDSKKRQVRLRRTLVTDDINENNAPSQSPN